MPPPPSYLDVTSVPFSQLITQADFNGGTYGGTANTLWIRRITTAQVALGLFTTKGGTFKADTTLYQSDGTTVIRAETGASNFSFFTIVPAGTYFIKIVRHGGGASDFDFTVNIDERPTDADVLPLTAGQFIINDDSNGFPATVLNADGSVAGYLTTIPAGETGAFLPTGESLWHDRFGMVGPANQLALFDADLTYVTSIDIGLGSPLPIITRSHTDFFVLDRNGGEVWKITAAGVATDLNFVTASDVPSAAAADADGSILYWVEAEGNAAIHRYDLVGMAGLSDFVTLTGVNTAEDVVGKTPNGHPGDLLMLSDGRFVLWYEDVSASEYVLLHLDADGTELHRYTYSSPTTIDHLFPVGDADHVGIWLFTTFGFDEGRIGILDLATGTIADDFTKTMFSSTENLQTDESTIFSFSASCTIFAIGAVGGGGGGGGGDDDSDEIIGPLLVIHMPREIFPPTGPEPT